MVPVLARSAERAASDPAERARVGQITSALLTWSVLILVPLTLRHRGGRRADRIAAQPRPIANAHCVHAEVVATTGSMLVVFAPQVVLYGLSVVLVRAAAGVPPVHRARAGTGDLQPGAHRLPISRSCPWTRGSRWRRLPLTAELVLSVGTTLGIAALVARRRGADAGGCTCGSGPRCGSRPGLRAGPAAWRSSAWSSLSPSTWPTLRGHRPGQRARGDRRDRHLQLRRGRCSTPWPRCWRCRSSPARSPSCPPATGRCSTGPAPDRRGRSCSCRGSARP